MAEGSRCGDYVAIQGGRPTIDTETGRVTMIGEVLVAGAAVENLRVCMGEICSAVAEGTRLANGQAARFAVTARGRPGAFTVKCDVIR